MSEIVLPQQVFAIVISIRCPDHAMNVLLGWLYGISGKPPQVGRLLMIEFNHDHRTLYPVIEDAVGLRASYPREPRIVEIAIHLVHLHSCVPIVEIAHVQLDQVAETLPRWRCK